MGNITRIGETSSSSTKYEWNPHLQHTQEETRVNTSSWSGINRRKMGNMCWKTWGTRKTKGRWGKVPPGRKSSPFPQRVNPEVPPCLQTYWIHDRVLCASWSSYREACSLSASILEQKLLFHRQVRYIRYTRYLIQYIRYIPAFSRYIRYWYVSCRTGQHAPVAFSSLSQIVSVG